MNKYPEAISEDYLKKNRQSGSIRIGGVYFLYKWGELIYIGSTADFQLRLKQHQSNSYFKFDKYVLYPVDSDLNTSKERLEASCIKKYRPRFNCKFNPDYEQGLKPVWFTFITQWKSFKKVAESCDSKVTYTLVERVVNNRTKHKDNLNDIESIKNTILTKRKRLSGFKPN